MRMQRKCRVTTRYTRIKMTLQMTLQMTPFMSTRPPDPYLTGLIGWGFSMQFPREAGDGTAA